MPSGQKTEGRTKPVILALFILSYAAAASASAGLQLFQSTGQGVVPPPQGTASGAGGYFFVGAEGSAPSESSSDAQVGPPSGLPSYPESQPSPGADSMFILEGGSYAVVPTSGANEEGSPNALQSSAVLLVWEEAEPRRSRFRIYIEILDVLKGGPMTPFEIAFRLRLNSKRAKRYVSHLTEKGMLEPVGERGLTVALTESGRVFADDMRKAILLD
jgi:predicted transcriptional regulator